jgi:hypothetical protein
MAPSGGSAVLLELELIPLLRRTINHCAPLRLNARKSIRLLAIHAVSHSFDGIYAAAGNLA